MKSYIAKFWFKIVENETDSRWERRVEHFSADSIVMAEKQWIEKYTKQEVRLIKIEGC